MKRNLTTTLCCLVPLYIDWSFFFVFFYLLLTSLTLTAFRFYSSMPPSKHHTAITPTTHWDHLIQTDLFFKADKDSLDLYSGRGGMQGHRDIKPHTKQLPLSEPRCSSGQTCLWSHMWKAANPRPVLQIPFLLFMWQLVIELRDHCCSKHKENYGDITAFAWISPLCDE